MDTEADLYQQIDLLEAERHSLADQIKQLERALDKEKKFHRKFAEDVIQSEESRNLDFEKQRKELLEQNKKLVAVNRELTKENSFYKTSYDSLMKEEDSKDRYHSAHSSSSYSAHSSSNYSAHSSCISDSISSNYSTATESASLPSKSRIKKSKEISKLSEKIFEENRRLKMRNTKLARDNTSLRLKVKQLENFKNKIQNKTSQHEADKIELQSLFQSTRRTNGQIFNPLALSKLRELSRD